MLRVARRSGRHDQTLIYMCAGPSGCTGRVQEHVDKLVAKVVIGKALEARSPGATRSRGSQFCERDTEEQNGADGNFGSRGAISWEADVIGPAQLLHRRPLAHGPSARTGAVTRLSGISMGLEALARLWGHTSSALVIQASHVRNLSGCSVDAGVTSSASNLPKVRRSTVRTAKGVDTLIDRNSIERKRSPPAGDQQRRGIRPPSRQSRSW